MHRDMRSESAASGNELVRSVTAAAVADTRGKHRISAELKRLEQETRFLEEELEQLEKMEKASAACREMLSIVETKPDPLLPIVNTSKQLGFNPAVLDHNVTKLSYKKRAARQILLGIDGLKDPKNHRVADVGYCDGWLIARTNL